MLPLLISAVPHVHTYGSPATYEWETLSSLPTTRQEHSVAKIGNKVYVIGGTTTNESATTVAYSAAFGIRTVRDVSVYDTQSNSWTEAAPMPISVNHGNAATVNGKIYVLSGLSGANLTTWNAIPESYVYDPTANIWTEIAPMPRGTARGACAVGVHGPVIYLAGGLTQLELKPDGLQPSVAYVTSFNTETGRWHTEFPPIPGARDHFSGAVFNGVFYVTGGRQDSQFNTRNNTWALDLANTTAWVDKAPMPTARGGHATTSIGRYIFTFGGEGNPDAANGVFDNTEVFDTALNTWLIGPAMTVPRHGTNAVAIGKRVYIPGGGIHVSTDPTNTMTAFQPDDRRHLVGAV
jgi:N-acetylneuraminic acid mutarotase